MSVQKPKSREEEIVDAALREAPVSFVRPVEPDGWPMCPTPDCENKVCLWAGTGLCYPCSERQLGKPEMDRRYQVTRVSADDLRWNGKAP